MEVDKVVKRLTSEEIASKVAKMKSLCPKVEEDIRIVNFFNQVAAKTEDALKTLMIDKFESRVTQQPQKTFFIFEEKTYSYKCVDVMACRVANVGLDLGLKPNDCVALLSENEPEAIWTFLGLQKLGVSVALVNYNLRLGPLIHCLKAVEPKFLIIGTTPGLHSAALDILKDLDGVRVLAYGLGFDRAPPGIESLEPLLMNKAQGDVSPTVRRCVKLEDTSLYIYTSGTTGLPKPVIISQARAISSGMICSSMGMSEPTDIVYIPLPLYHGAGHFGGLCATILTGGTMVLRRHFSASQFWEDCRRYDVTVIFYIGEILRFVLAVPPSKLDSVHKVRRATGAGMRKDIFEKFTTRFNIPEICEFYSSTEGTSALLNFDMKPGAVGRMSPFLELSEPIHKVLVKFDLDTSMPIRDNQGRCIRAQVGEPGLYISKVPEIMLKNGLFDVYRSSKEANEKKFIRNAFNKGDVYFNFGDILVLDDEYYVYFADRTGDTYRWKGENVSTTEVANIITSLDFVTDANVYGVTIPGNDGKAGMVALTLKDDCILCDTKCKQLYDHVVKELPHFARPLFVRHLRTPILTGTFKQQKVELAKEGYDFNRVKDPLYFLNRKKETYSPVTPADLVQFLQSKL